MRLVVQQYLNARTGSPFTNAPVPFYRNPGHILQVDDVRTGEELEGNNIWYHNEEDGCYYWSGVVSEPEEFWEHKTFSDEEWLSIYRSAVNDLPGRFKSIPGFKGLGAGLKTTEGKVTQTLALIFYVFQKTPDNEGKVPKVVNYRGIPLVTDVREVGAVSLLAGNEADRATPYQMGGSISEDMLGQAVSFGTRTLLVVKDKKEYLLTCYHVACNSLFKKGTYSLGSNKVNVVLPSSLVTTGKRTFRLPVAMGSFNNLYDVALIEIENASLFNGMPDVVFDQFYTRDELKSGLFKGIPLSKYGAATQRGKAGMLIAYHSEQVEVSTNQQLMMSGLVESSPMSESGDSGAPVVDARNGKLVGFIVAGNSQVSYILPFAQLVFELHIEPKL